MYPGSNYGRHTLIVQGGVSETAGPSEHGDSSQLLPKEHYGRGGLEATTAAAVVIAIGTCDLVVIIEVGTFNLAVV